MFNWFELERSADAPARVPASHPLSMAEFKSLQARSPGDIYDLIAFFIINRINDITRGKRPSLSLRIRSFSSYLYYKLIGSRSMRHLVHYNENPDMYRDMLGRTQAYTCGFTTSANSALPDDWRSRQWAPRCGDSSDVDDLKVTLLQTADLCALSRDDPLRSEFMLHPFDTPFDLKLDLDGMQTAKFDRICRKLQLRPGQRLLDIGCGYGCFSIHAAKYYGVQVTAFAATSQMVEGAIANARAEGVAEKCRFFVAEVAAALNSLPAESFDAVAAIGFMEHVLPPRYNFIFDRIHALLRHDGKVLLHMMCSSEKPNRPDAFIQTYVFPMSNQNVASDLLERLEVTPLAFLLSSSHVRVCVFCRNASSKCLIWRTSVSTTPTPSTAGGEISRRTLKSILTSE